MKKIIETALPLQELSQSAMSDKAHKGHPGNMHLWWNRSPIDSSSALLYAALQDVIPEESSQQSQEVSRIALEGAAPVMKSQELPTVVDPFSGFGGLVMAAQRLGLKTEASDLNAVATLLTKAAAEIPSRFADCRAVNQEAENKMYFGLQGLAADVKYYGNWLKKQAQERLVDSYPESEAPEGNEKLLTYAWVWTRTVKCPNPVCGCQMPLASSYVLSKLKGQEYWAEPVVDDKSVTFTIHQGVCPADKETNKHGSVGSKFQCPACGVLTTDEYMKKAGKEGKLGIQLMAVSALKKSGRVFIEASDDQIKAASLNRQEDLPIGSLPNNTRWFSPPSFGMTEYSDLYTPRQMRLMTTLCDLIAEVQDKAASDALSIGMSADGGPLVDGGAGALAYGQAVGVYLTMVIGKLANFQSTVCTWDNRNGNVRAAFTRQAIPMTWVFAEGNPFSTVTGNFDTMLRNVVESVEKLLVGNAAAVHQANAITRQYPDNSILFTELPYYDNVGYADLSDYFYIWMRRCLKNTYPGLFEKVVTSKEELSSIAEHFEGDNAALVAKESYRSGIEQLCSNFYQAASEEYPSVIFFEYSKLDDRVISSGAEVTDLSPLEHLLFSITNVGFMVTGIWPVRTEKPNPRFESLRIAVVFRKKSAEAQNVTRRGVINTLKRELPGMLEVAFRKDVDELDKPIAGLGLGLSVLTRYKKVMNADGSDMGIHDALQLIHQEVIDFINVHSDDAQTEEE